MDASDLFDFLTSFPDGILRKVRSVLIENDGPIIVEIVSPLKDTKDKAELEKDEK